MAAVGPEVAGSWFLSSGLVSIFILLLLLSIFLTALCTDCKRQSFDLQDAEVDKNHLSLISVVKLEEALRGRENPIINEIQNHEVSAEPISGSPSPWMSHLAALQDPELSLQGQSVCRPPSLNNEYALTNGVAEVTKTTRESDEVAAEVVTDGVTAVTNTTSESEAAAEEEDVIEIIPWRSHLSGRQSQDLNSSAHIYQFIDGGWSNNNADKSSTYRQDDDGEAEAVALDRNSMYAQISMKVRPTRPADHAPEQGEVESTPSEG